MIDGLGLGDNAKGTFITLGWAEIVSLGVALGADRETFYGLAGLGDLIATCSSSLSRNHRVGYELGMGKTLAETKAVLPRLSEGVTTAAGVRYLVQKSGMRTPITGLVHQVLFENFSPQEAFLNLWKLILP